MDSQSEELILIDKAKNFDEDAIKQLHELHYKICLTVGRKYYMDIRDSTHLLIWEAITTFNKEKHMQFSTWLWWRSFYYCQKELKYQRKEKFNLTQEPEKEDDRIETLNYYINKIPKAKVRSVMKSRYCGKELLTFKQLSVMFGLTVSRLQQIDSIGNKWLRQQVLQEKD